MRSQYLILRDMSGYSSIYGRAIRINIALPGTADEWEQVYEEALNAAYENVARQMQVTGRPWKFSTPDFEIASLYVTENRGQFDTATLESSEFPVVLAIMMHEHHVIDD